MRALLVLSMLAASAAGCHKFKPAPIVLPAVPVDNPSILVNPPYPGEDKTGAQPGFPKMFAIGNASHNIERTEGTYQASLAYTLGRGDKADVDPQAVAEEIRRWIRTAPRVTVTTISEDTSVPGRLCCTIDYETAGTVGYAIYSVEPVTPAKSVSYKLTVRERRR